MSAQAGALIGAGLASAGQSLAAGADAYAAEAKKAKTLRALFEQYGAEMGMPELKDRAAAMSLPQLEGGLKAYVLKQDREERAARTREQNARENLQYVQTQSLADAVNRNRTEAAQQTAGQQSLGAGLSALANMPPEGLRAPGFDERTAFLQAAGPNLGFAAGTPAGARILSDVLGGNLGNGGMDVQEVTLPSGARIVKGGQRWDFVPDDRSVMTEYQQGRLVADTTKAFNTAETAANALERMANDPKLSPEERANYKSAWEAMRANADRYDAQHREWTGRSLRQSSTSASGGTSGSANARDPLGLRK